MRRMILATAVALTAIGALPTASAQSNTFTVDCNRGQKIAKALELGDFRKPVLVNVRGTCLESVTITRDDVTLRGDPAATIMAPDPGVDVVYVRANGVTLENLTLVGGAFGMRIDGAVRAIARKVVIQASASHGVQAFVGDIRFMDCTIEDAGGNGVNVVRGASVVFSQGSDVRNNRGAGIYVEANGIVLVTGSTTISGNGGDGVALENGASGTIRGSTLEKNGVDPSRGGNGLVAGMARAVVLNSTISDNREHGILIQAGSTAGIDGNTITGNGGTGVFGYLGPTLVLHGNTIAGNAGHGVDCTMHCTLQIGGATIQGNALDGIALNLGSKLLFEAPVTDAAGNGGWGLWCGGAESSVIELPLFNGSVSPSCTDYE